MSARNRSPSARGIPAAVALPRDGSATSASSGLGGRLLPPVRGRVP